MAEEAPVRRPLDEPKTLDQYKTEINTAYKAMTDAAKDIVPRAIRFGELLNRAKDETRHNDWLTWLKENCALEKRTAQRYMKLATNKAKVNAWLQGLSVDEVRDVSLNKALAVASDKAGGGGGSKTVMQRYTSAEETLIKKLKELELSDAETCVASTTRQLKDTLSTLKSGAAKKAA
jgi:hypothetical protein